MTAESERIIKALAGLLSNEDLYDDDLFFSGSVKQKQQLIVEKLSKNAPIKDNGVTLVSSHQHQQRQQHHQQQQHKQQEMTVFDTGNHPPSHNNNNSYNDEEVRFGGSANQNTFVSASVRERAAAMSGFLTKKKEGPTSGQARAMEWRSGGGNRIECPQKIASNFVSQFDRVENDVNGGTPTNNQMKMKKKKSKPSFLFQFDDSPRADMNGGGNFKDEDGENAPRAPLTPRTPRAPLTPRTPSQSTKNNSSNNKNNCLLSPRTPRTQTTTPRGRHRTNMLPSPRASMMIKSPANFEEAAAVNCSMAVEAGSVTEEIDNWLGGMSLSDSEGEDEEVDNESNGDDEFFMNDLDKVLSEANGFLVGVVDTEMSNEEEEEEKVHFDFSHEEENEGSNSDDLESELESARKLAQDFTRFLGRDDGFMSPVAARSVDICSSNSSSDEVVENFMEEVEELVEKAQKNVDYGWEVDEDEEEEVVEEEDGQHFVLEEEEKEVMGKEVEEELVEEEVEVVEEECVLSESVEDDAVEELEAEDDNVNESEGDWEGWTRNNDFFNDFDEEDAREDASQVSEPVAPQKEITLSQEEEPEAPHSLTKAKKPKLRIQIKGAPEFKPTEKEEEEAAFFYASQPSPLARDDEQLLDSELMPSPVAEEPKFSQTEASPKKVDRTPKKFGLKKIVHRACPENDDESISSKTETSPKRIHISPKKLVLKKMAHRACLEEEESVEKQSSFGEETSAFQPHFDMSVSLTKSDETEKKAAKSPPKLNIYIKGAPQFTASTQFEEEDAFYFSQPSPLVGDDKGLLSSNFSSSPTEFGHKKENTLTSSTKKHLKKLVHKTLPASRYQNTKFEQDNANVFSDDVGPDCFNNDFFFSAPASPVRQAKEAMKEGGSTKKKILGLLSGKKKKQSRGLYLLDD